MHRPGHLLLLREPSGHIRRVRRHRLHEGEGTQARTSKIAPLMDTASGIPHGIIGFAIGFFVVAMALRNEVPVEALVNWIEELPPAWQVATTMLATAGLVNTINDLPAAALVGHLLAQSDSPLVTQSALASLNVSCYLLPTGAHAGIIFFHLMRQQELRHGTIVPRPLNLLWYGGIHFIAVSAALCAVMPGYHEALSVLTDGQSLEFIAQPGALSSLSLSVGVSTAVALFLALGLRRLSRE